MPVRTKRRTSAPAPIEANQVCARGWQDYMIETQMYADETRVSGYLKTLNDRQRANLGVVNSRVQASAHKH